MKLIEVDALGPQAFKLRPRPGAAARPSVRIPASPARAHDPAFGADDQALGVGIQSFRDEGFEACGP